MDNRPILERSQFLNMAALFEGGLVVVAVILGWLTATDPFELLSLSWTAVGIGIIAVIPMLVLFLASLSAPWSSLNEIREFLVRTLGPLLDQCRWFDLVLLAMLAGITEEILFRGAIQPLLMQLCADSQLPINPLIGGVVLTSILFGFAHLITPTYGVMAAVMGAYLSGVQILDPDRNLLAPIVTHAVYDWIAFVVVLRDYRRTNEAHSSAQ